MKSINDSKLYLGFTIATFSIAVLLGAVSFYSIMSVEPKVEKYIAAGAAVSVDQTAPDAKKELAAKKASESYVKAYELLRKGQIFGRYEYFDQLSSQIKNTIKRMDALVLEKKIIPGDYRIYLNILLERRMLGSRLGRNTMIFFFLLSLIGLGFYGSEKRWFKKQAV